MYNKQKKEISPKKKNKQTKEREKNLPKTANLT
jgi:hypothetical protein